jgi:hypothetical protein
MEPEWFHAMFILAIAAHCVSILPLFIGAFPEPSNKMFEIARLTNDPSSRSIATFNV